MTCPGLFATGPSMNLAQILQYSLPDRKTSDRRVASFLTTKHAVLPCIHVPQFQRLYNDFWKDPFSVPLNWVAQLFCIFCLSIQTSNLASGTQDDGQAAACMIAAAQVLQLGDFTRPAPFLLEALILYGSCAYCSSRDPTGETWALLGLVRQQAFRMGYHRDPKHLPKLSAFNSEMRRRTWALILQFDLLSACQMGLPPVIQSGK